MNAGCTIVSPNYLPFARVLAESYRKAHPTHTFYVLIVAELDTKHLFGEGEPFIAILLSELDIPNLASIAFRYDILELNTSVKPTFLKYLFKRFALDILVYLDPDIYVYNQLTPVLDELGRSNVVLTPHITSPIADGPSPNENTFLTSGVYNLGFIAIKAGPETARFLEWWESRCLTQGFSEPTTGLFVDQKWLNLAPCLFDGVSICKDAGCNVAYWNLHERVIGERDCSYVVNEHFDLRFFHFSGISMDGGESISKYTSKYRLSDRVDLAPLFAAYRDRVKRSQLDSTDRIPYGFDRFTNGAPVGPLLRRIYSQVDDLYAGNPFDATGAFYRDARRKGLIVRADPAVKSSWKDYRPSDRRVRCVKRLLKTTLRILGPGRYTLLMKYLAHISVLRRQGFLLSE